MANPVPREGRNCFSYVELTDYKGELRVSGHLAISLSLLVEGKMKQGTRLVEGKDEAVNKTET